MKKPVGLDGLREVPVHAGALHAFGHFFLVIARASAQDRTVISMPFRSFPSGFSGGIILERFCLFWPSSPHCRKARSLLMTLGHCGFGKLESKIKRHRADQRGKHPYVKFSIVYSFVNVNTKSEYLNQNKSKFF
jgi:hypothetical protein